MIELVMGTYPRRYGGTIGRTTHFDGCQGGVVDCNQHYIRVVSTYSANRNVENPHLMNFLCAAFK